MAEFPSAKLKIDWANEQFKLLSEMVDGFMQDQPYTLSMENEVDPGNYRVVIKILKSPPTDWSLYIGSILYHLRSALDHIAYELAADNGSDQSILKSTEFPVFKSDNLYHSVERGGGLYKIRGISSPNLRALFEECQPFCGGQDPLTHKLWVLQELCNIDKHRFLHITNLVTGSSDLKLEVEGNLPVETLYIRADGPTEDGAILARWHVGNSAQGLKAKVRVKSNVTYAIMFDDRSGPAAGSYVRNGLTELGEAVGSIWSEFKRRS